MTKDEIIIFLQEYKVKHLVEYSISQLALFGSYANGTNRDSSDIDLAMWSTEKNYFTLITMRNQLAKELGIDVDLGYFDSMKSFIKESIKDDLIYV